SQTARPTSARIETEAARRFAPNSPKGTFDVLAKPDIFICYQQFISYRALPRELERENRSEAEIFGWKKAGQLH
ncbi:MAG: hypothetical protein AB7V18_19970, partial [Pyrinomonadaceae bacterium]